MSELAFCKHLNELHPDPFSIITSKKYTRDGCFFPFLYFFMLQPWQLSKTHFLPGSHLKNFVFTFSFCSSESISQKNKVPLVNQLTFLGQTFSRLVDLTLGLLVQRIVDYLDSNSSTVLHAAIACLISLGLDGEHMCFIIARVGIRFLCGRKLKWFH